MDKVLIIIDMQNDFIDGVLGSPEAVKICGNVAEKITNWDGNKIIYTLDTHINEIYPLSVEGQKIPFHCAINSWGHNIHDLVLNALTNYLYNINHKTYDIEKDTFGSVDELLACVEEICPKNPFEIHICGLCTDICVISNALILRSAFPQAKIYIDAKCCAGSTPENHNAALKIMEANCINILNKE